MTQLASEGKVLPDYVHQEFDEYLECGRLEYGFPRVQCDCCHEEQLAWAMRQWVLSVPHPLRYLFASQPKVMGKIQGIVYLTLATHLRGPT